MVVLLFLSFSLSLARTEFLEVKSRSERESEDSLRTGGEDTASQNRKSESLAQARSGFLLRTSECFDPLRENVTVEIGMEFYKKGRFDALA